MSGNRSNRLFCALVLGVLALMSGASSAASWSIADLMAALSLNKSGHASFVEQKYISMLDAPVESSGELYFEAPDRLEKRTLKPKTESIVLKGDQLSFERDKRSMRVSLNSYPQVAAFVESIRGTLAGDRQALEKVYQLELEGSAEKWLLTLMPRASETQEIIKRIRIAGQRGEVRSIEIEQTDGDRSVMTITRVIGS